MQALCEANSAALGGLISTATTYPVDVVKTKMQASPVDGKAKYASSWECFTETLKSDGGFQVLFTRGLGIKLVWSAVGKFMFYGAYSWINSTYQSVMGGAPSFSHALLMGYLAELSTVPASLPFEAIATRLQTSRGLSTWAAASQIWNDSKYGFDGFYKSVSAYFFLSWQSAIVNTIFTQLKTWFIQNRAKTVLTTFESFVLGGISRCIGLCLMFPLLRVKSILQSASKNSDTKDKGVFTIIQDILSKPGGAFILYRGLGPELLRGVMSTAVTLTVKEQAYASNHRFLVTLTGSSPSTTTS
jgi:hypothetical protein